MSLGIQPGLFGKESYPAFMNRFNSERVILQPLPALAALIFPKRIYLRRVGFEILRYSHASFVVKILCLFAETKSSLFRLNDLDLFISAP